MGVIFMCVCHMTVLVSMSINSLLDKPSFFPAMVKNPKLSSLHLV